MTKAPETSKQENKKTRKQAKKERKECVNMKKSTITSRLYNGKELKAILQREVPNSLKHIYNNIAESQWIPAIYETGIMQNVRFNETTVYRGKAYTAGESVQMDKVYVQVLLDSQIDVTVTNITENDVE